MTFGTTLLFMGQLVQISEDLDSLTEGYFNFPANKCSVVFAVTLWLLASFFPDSVLCIIHFSHPMLDAMQSEVLAESLNKL